MTQYDKGKKAVLRPVEGTKKFLGCKGTQDPLKRAYAQIWGPIVKAMRVGPTLKSFTR